jgi:hypothetical protein
MALDTEFTTFTISSGATADIDVTLGFQPQGYFVWANGMDDATDAVESGHMFASFGVGDDNSTPRRWCIGGYSENAAGTSVTNTAIRADAIVVETDSSDTVTGLLDIDAVANWPTDGIRFNIDDAFVNTVKVEILAFAGSDISNVYVGNDTAPTASPFLQDITSPGFDTDAIALVVTPVTSGDSLPYVGAGFAWSLGFGAERGTSQYEGVLAAQATDAQTTSDANKYAYTAECGATFWKDSPTIFNRCSFVGTIANGFQLDWHDASGTARRFGYMAIAGTAKFHVDSFTQSTQTVDDQIERTGYGGTPGLLLFATSGAPFDSQDTPSAHGQVSLGGGTSTSERGALCWFDKDGETSTQVVRAIEYDAIGVMATYASGVEQTTTVDYTSVKSNPTPSWTNPSNIATSDTTDAEWHDADGWPSSSLQIEVDDAPGDHNGSSINTVQFEVIWSLSGTASRAKNLTLSWRKADTTVIHSWTTSGKTSSGEETMNEGGFQAPSGTSSVTDTEWDNSYIQIVANEGGGKGDSIDVYVDYVKIDVKYEDNTGGPSTDGKMDIYAIGSDGATFVNDEALGATWGVNVFAISPAAAVTDGEVTEVASLRVKAQSEVTEVGSIRTKGQSEITEVASIRTKIQSEVTDATSIRITLQGEITDVASLRAKAPSEVTDPASVRIALRGEVTDTASIRTALRNEVTDAASIRAALRSEVTDAASVRTALPGESTDTASVRVALQSEVTDVASLRTKAPSEVTDLASIRIEGSSETTEPVSVRIVALSEVTDSASVRTALQSEVTAVASIRTALRSEITDTASIRIALQGEVYDTASIRILGSSEVTEVASIRVASADQGEVTDVASVRIKGLSEVTDAASVRTKLLSEVAELASIRAALQSEVADAGSIRAKSPAEATDVASVRIALQGEATSSSSVRTALRGEITDIGSIRLALQGEVTDPASIRIEGSSEVTEVASIRVEITGQGEVTDAGSIRAKAPSEITDAASVRIALEGEVADVASIRTALRGEATDVGSVRLALQSEITDAASIRLALPSQVTSAASIRSSLQSEVTEVASVRTALRGDSTDDASVRILGISEVIENASVRVSITGAGEVTDVASIRAKLQGEVTETASLRVALQGEATDVGSIRLSVLSEVTDPASIRTAIYSERTDVASVRIALQGEATDAVSLRLKAPSEVTAAASIRIAEYLLVSEVYAEIDVQPVVSAADIEVAPAVDGTPAVGGQVAVEWIELNYEEGD